MTVPFDPRHGPTCTGPAGSLLSALVLPAVLLLAAGCATVPPEPPPDPAGVQVPETWSAAPEAEPGAEAAAEAEGLVLPPDGIWWRSFDDPALDRLLEQALTENRNLRAAAARLEAAEARARIAGADLYPQVSAGGSGSRRRQNFIGFPIPGADGSSGEQVLSTTTTNLGVSLDVSWEADLWGRLRNAEAAAEDQLVAARADYAGALLSLTGQTAKAYYAALEARRQLALAEATLETRELSTARVRRRYEAGLRGPLDLRLALADEASARAAVALRRRLADQLTRQLQVLVGTYPDGLVPELALAAGDREAGEEPGSSPGAAERATALARSLPAPPAGVPAALPSELVARRPDLAAFERRLAAAGHGVAQARAALYPQVRLTGSVGRASEELEDLLDNDFTVWSLAGNLLQPLFQGGRLRANVDLSQATFDEAVAAYGGQILTAFAEVETALAADRFLAERAEALDASARQSEAARELAEGRYRQGLQDLLTVLDSQRGTYQAQSLLLEVQRQRLEARVDLILALGGGFDRELLDERPLGEELFPDGPGETGDALSRNARESVHPSAPQLRPEVSWRPSGSARSGLRQNSPFGLRHKPPLSSASRVVPCEAPCRGLQAPLQVNRSPGAGSGVDLPKKSSSDLDPSNPTGARP